MRAIFFFTSSNSPSVLLNCRRVLACSTASRRQVLAAPVQQAPKVVRPKSSTVSATRSPLPSGPRMFSFGTRMLFMREPAGRRAADAELRHARLDHLEARHVGRDEKRGDRVLVLARNWACAP